MNRTIARKLSDDLELILQKFADEHNYHLTMKGGTIDSTSLLVKFELAERSSNTGDAMTPEAKAFKLYAPHDGISADLLFADVTLNGEPAKFCGYKVRATKMPYLAKTSEHTYKLTVEQAQRLAATARAGKNG